VIEEKISGDWGRSCDVKSLALPSFQMETTNLYGGKDGITLGFPIYDHLLLERRIQELHNLGKVKAYLSTTGAAAGAPKLLWDVAGCSATLVAASFPYLQAASADFVGHPVEKYLAESMAIRLANAAYIANMKLTDGDPNCIGVGATCAVQTTRDRRGKDLVIAALRTLEHIHVVTVELQKGELNRKEQGEVSDLIVANLVLFAAGVAQVPISPAVTLTSDELIKDARGWTLEPKLVTPAAPSELLSFFGIDGEPTEPPEKFILFPGSWRPMHFGHHKIAERAEEIYKVPVFFEVATSNADKGEIDDGELGRRLLQFRGLWPTVVNRSKTPRFVDKASLYGPGTSMLIGVDTAERIVDSKYYDDLATTMNQLRAAQIQFLVIGREDEKSGKFRNVWDAVPHEHLDLFTPLPGRWNISSSAIRARMAAAENAPAARF